MGLSNMRSPSRGPARPYCASPRWYSPLRIEVGRRKAWRWADRRLGGGQTERETSGVNAWTWADRRSECKEAHPHKGCVSRGKLPQCYTMSHTALRVALAVTTTAWCSCSASTASTVQVTGYHEASRKTMRLAPRRLQIHTASTPPSSGPHFLPDEGVQPVLVVPQTFQFEPLFKEAVTVWILPDEVHSCRSGF